MAKGFNRPTEQPPKSIEVALSEIRDILKDPIFEESFPSGIYSWTLDGKVDEDTLGMPRGKIYSLDQMLKYLKFVETQDQGLINIDYLYQLAEELGKYRDEVIRIKSFTKEKLGSQTGVKNESGESGWRKEMENEEKNWYPELKPRGMGQMTKQDPHAAADFELSAEEKLNITAGEPDQDFEGSLGGVGKYQSREGGFSGGQFVRVTGKHQRDLEAANFERNGLVAIDEKFYQGGAKDLLDSILQTESGFQRDLEIYFDPLARSVKKEGSDVQWLSRWKLRAKWSGVECELMDFAKLLGVHDLKIFHLKDQQVVDEVIDEDKPIVIGRTINKDNAVVDIKGKRIKGEEDEEKKDKRTTEEKSLAQIKGRLSHILGNGFIYKDEAGKEHVGLRQVSINILPKGEASILSGIGFQPGEHGWVESPRGDNLFPNTRLGRNDVDLLNVDIEKDGSEGTREQLQAKIEKIKNSLEVFALRAEFDFKRGVLRFFEDNTLGGQAVAVITGAELGDVWPKTLSKFQIKRFKRQVLEKLGLEEFKAKIDFIDLSEEGKIGEEEGEMKEEGERVSELHGRRKGQKRQRGDAGLTGVDDLIVSEKAQDFGGGNVIKPRKKEEPEYVRAAKEVGVTVTLAERGSRLDHKFFGFLKTIKEKLNGFTLLIEQGQLTIDEPGKSREEGGHHWITFKDFATVTGETLELPEFGNVESEARFSEQLKEIFVKLGFSGIGKIEFTEGKRSKVESSKGMIEVAVLPENLKKERFFLSLYNWQKNRLRVKFQMQKGSKPQVVIENLDEMQIGKAEPRFDFINFYPNFKEATGVDLPVPKDSASFEEFMKKFNQAITAFGFARIEDFVVPAFGNVPGALDLGDTVKEVTLNHPFFTEVLANLNGNSENYQLLIDFRNNSVWLYDKEKKEKNLRGIDIDSFRENLSLLRKDDSKEKDPLGDPDLVKTALKKNGLKPLWVEYV